MADSLQLTDGVDISVSVIDRPLPLTISGSRLRQLALNIVRNALEALKTTEKPRLTIEGYVRPRSKLDDAALSEASSAAESFLLLAFADNGPGIEPRDMERLFEPFFTTRAEGTGLGLAISYNIAHAHGGYIEVDSKAGRGSTFRVGLPVSDEAG
jgi:signal transduction histidine kinase